MTCQRVTTLIADYLAKDLEPDTASSFERHLSSCPDCPALLSTYKKTVQVVRSLRYDDISYARMSRMRRLLHHRIQDGPICH